MSHVPKLRRLKTQEAVREYLGLSEEIFQAAIAIPKSVWAFERYDIPKRNTARGHRTVWEPSRDLKPAYKALARRLHLYFQSDLDGYPHDAAFGFMVGRNILGNATAHTGHRFLLATDIEGFFPSISEERVLSLLVQLGLEYEVATTIARFVTIDGALPAGVPTSPVISNAIAMPLDRALSELAKRSRATYTRYVDDLAFSSNAEPPDVDQIARVVEDQGFRLAVSKTRRSKIGQAHFVTGLSISDPVRPHVPRRTKHRLRQELYYAKKFGLDDHLDRLGYSDWREEQSEINRLDGMVKFVAHHEPNLASALKRDWREALLESGCQPSFEPRNQHHAPFAIFIDEAELNRNGRPVLALAMAATQHAEVVGEIGNRVLQDYLSNPYADGHYEVIKKKGLHYTDAPIDLRQAYVNAMQSMPFEGYVAFVEYEHPSGYEAAYLKLLEAMLPRRLMAAESQCAYLVFEETDKVSQPAIQACVTSAYCALAKRGDRHPARFETNYVSKPHVGIPVPDWLLGVLNHYLNPPPQKPGKPPPKTTLMFEQMRDKYRVILDLTNNVEYSRRRPIEPWV